MIQSVLLALVPVVLLIALGHVLRRRHWLAEGFWPAAEKLGYYVLLPALFIHGLATAELPHLPIGWLIVVLVGPICAVSALLLLAKPLMRVDNAGFTSVFQGGIRFNNYVGITLAAGLLGVQGVALAAICSAIIVPTVNVLCVLMFMRHGQGRFSLPALGRQLALNPLILGSLVGLALQISGLGLSPWLEPAVKALGQASLAVGLLCVGAAVTFSDMRQWLRPLFTASAAKFLAMPAVTAAACALVGLTGPAALVALLLQTMPTASSSYIMARQMGGDAPMMAAITAAQTVLAALAIPLVLGFWLT